LFKNPTLSIIPISAEVHFKPFDLGTEIWKASNLNGVTFENGDILVVSSKYAAISEGRMIELSNIVANEKARDLAEKFCMDPSLAQIVIDESDEIFGGIPGFVLTLNKGSLAPNAGIDRSNVPDGWAIPYPKDPFKTAKKLREQLMRFSNQNNARHDLTNFGVILSDSRVTPTRLGTVGVAIAYAGIRPTIDLRGTADLCGNSLKVTLRATADQLATAAQLMMGESNEARPIVVIRGFMEAFVPPRNEFEERTTIPPDQCLIIRSLRNSDNTLN
jgi:coenzyme F420-0:L-glutamate ligase / coenzyme F420-1:gamma-L-glutamate ligase